MAERKSPVSPFRLRVVYVSDNIHSLSPTDEDRFASAFPLNVSEDLVVLSLKQQNFTSLYHLLTHRLSRYGLRYIEHHLPMVILSRLPRLVREASCYSRQLVELSLVGVVNEDDRSAREVLGQQAHLRLVTQRPLNVTDHAQVRVTEKCEELCKSTFSFRLVTDGRLYQQVTRQLLLEIEVCFHHCITVWSPFDLLHGLPCERLVKISFLTKVLLRFPEDYNLNFVDYTACSLARMFPSTTALLHRASHFPLLSRVSLVLTGQENILPPSLLRALNDRTLGVFSATLKVIFLEQAELGIGLVGTGLKTLTLCIFHVYAAAVSEERPVLKNRERKDLKKIIPSDQLSFLRGTHFKSLLRLKVFLNKTKGTKPEQLPCPL